MITRLHCSALQQRPFQGFAYYSFCLDFSQFVVTTESVTACETSRDKPASLSLSTCLIYAHGLRLPLGLRCLRSAYPPCTPYIRFLFVRLQFRYPFFSPTPHDVNLGSRYGVRRQLRPYGLSPQTDGMPVIPVKSRLIFIRRLFYIPL